MHDDTDGVPERIFEDADRDVWVVERNPGGGWRVSAVLTSFEDAQRYEQDLRAFFNDQEGIPEEFQHEVRTRHGGLNSPTKMWEEYPPTGSNRNEEDDESR